MTFNDIWDEFISNKKIRIKPSSVAIYVQLWMSLKKDFGDMDISSVSTKLVERWALGLLSRLSKHAIRDRIMLLNNMIDYYAYEYEVTVNRIQSKYIHWPTANIQKGELDNVKTFSPDEIKIMLGKIAEDPRPSRMLIAIMIGSGIRIGEACALTYGDINTNDGIIEVKGTVERITIDETYTEKDFNNMNVKLLHRAKKTALILSTPKCRASYRGVPIPRELLKILKTFKSIYPPAYYIGSNKFKPIEPRIMRKHYYEFLDECGIDKKLSPHSLRHTYATTLITSGVDVKTTAALLGHADTSTTLEIYSHATSESKKKAMTSTIGKRFKSTFFKLT